MSPLLHFVNSHGVECLAGAYVASAILSAMPPLPPNAKFLATWAYHVAQILRGSLAQYLKRPGGGE